VIKSKILTISPKLRRQLKQILYRSLIVGVVLLFCFLIQPRLLNNFYVKYCTDTTGKPDDYIRCFSSYWDFYYLFGIGSFFTLVVIPVIIGFYFLISKLWSENKKILWIILFIILVALLFSAKFISSEAKIFIKGFLSHNPQ
jgi:magnesium-transporting ATPase (P-type)